MTPTTTDTEYVFNTHYQQNRTVWLFKSHYPIDDLVRTAWMAFSLRFLMVSFQKTGFRVV